MVRLDETIEREIRETLIRREAEETYQLFETPEYEQKLIKFLKTIVSTVQTRFNKEFDEGLDLADEFLSEVKEDLLKSESLRKHAYEGAKNSWQSKEEVEGIFNDMYRHFNKTGEFGQDALSELKKAWSPVLEFCGYRDKIVQNLVEIAKRDGVDKATTKEAQYEAIRMVFPTAEEYMKQFKKGEGVFEKVSSGTQKAFAMDGEAGKFYGVLYAGLFKGIEEISKEVKDDWMKNQIKEIYNVQL
jgi:hypothetical protein